MSGVVSTIATLMAVGLEWSAVPKILRSWAFSYVIAFPASVLVMPVVRRIVSVIVKSPNA
jgi:phosphate/sulfate permease